MRRLQISLDGTGRREEYRELSDQEEQALSQAQADARAEAEQLAERESARAAREAAIDRLLAGAERKETDAR